MEKYAPYIQMQLPRLVNVEICQWDNIDRGIFISLLDVKWRIAGF